ncbi:MAG: peptidylprolyl isomerase, partial [Bacteroidetes bacterium]|nr:peptidylprolyl isomerase [Bacteroidota bacterium]
QMRDLLKTSLASTPEFLNEAGIFDENKLNEFIANLKALSPQSGVLGGQPITYASWVNYESNISANALQQNYNTLVKAGMIGTLEEGKLEYKLGEDNVDIKFVQIPFSTIPDSTITVSKSEISSYINTHKKLYEVDESRDISYVQFKEVASIEDENEIKESLLTLLNDRVEYNETTKNTDSILGFRKVIDNETYINSNSDIKYDKRYLYKSDLPIEVADSIFNLNDGEIYGPYKENNHFKISKVVAVIQMPDSVKARHILIPFIGSNSATAETIQTESQAKTTADSIMSIVKIDPSKFVDLLDFSADKVSNEKEGVLDWFVYNTMVPEFRDFSFENKLGDIGVVKSPFGFHVIEILDQKNIQRTVKVGTITKVISPSEATIDKVFRDASNFEIAISKSNVQDVAKENNYTVRPVNGIKILDENIPGLGNQRAIVRWAFNSDNEVGKFKRFDVPGGYAIVQLVAKNKEGLMSTEDASVTALPEIRKEKKAKIIKDRNSATLLEDFANAESQTVKSALAIN